MKGVTKFVQRRGVQLVAKPHEPLVNPVQIRDRKHLPDNWNKLLPQYLSNPKEDGFFGRFEAVSEDNESFQDWAKGVRRDVEAKLGEYGAVLLRDTPLKTGDDFSKFVAATGWQTKGDDAFARAMMSRSMTSTCISEYARTASDDHHDYTIEPHHEYHTVGFPNLILLFCEKCPESGGEWPVGNGRAILKALRPDVVEKFERLGTRYSLYYPSKHSPEGAIYNNWEQNLLPTKEETDAYLKSRGYTTEWGEDNSLRYYQNFPAVRIHPTTGERVWFNQIHAHHKSFYEGHPAFDGVQERVAREDKWPVNSSYGDGTPIEQEVLDHIRQVVWDNTVGVTPRQGDLLICENWLALHGRISFPTGKRDVFATTVFYEKDDEDEE